MAQIIRHSILCLFWILASFMAVAQMPDAAGVDERRLALATIAEAIEDADTQNLLDMREQVRDIRGTAEASAAPLRSRRAELEADINRLTPMSESGEIAENSELAERLKDLQQEFDVLDAIIRQSELNIVEANRLLEDIALRRRDAFYSRVLERDESPFRLSMFGPAMDSLGAGFAELGKRVEAWAAGFESPAERRTVIWSVLASVLFGGLLAWPARRWLDRNVVRRLQAYEPTRSRRVSVAGLRVLTRALPVIIGAYAVYEVAREQGIVTAETGPLILSILLGLVSILFADDFASAVFAPKLPEWRVIPLKSKRAGLVRLLMVLTVLVFSLNAVLNRGAEYLEASREVVTLLSAITSITSAVLLFLLVRSGIWELSQDRQVEYSNDTLRTWQRLRALARVFAVMVILAVLIGYVSLGRFAMSRVYYLSLLLTGAWFARALLGELAYWVSTRMSASVTGKDQPSITERREDERLYVFWFQLFIDTALAITVVPLAALIMGVEWTELRDWLFDALFGFRIGGFTISFAKVFSAVAALFFIMVLTRFVQRTTDARIFAPARMESGLRNTFRTLIGYTGLIIGAMAAIGTLGFPIANLAIVAGALSLGIGFGLQSIVNNFVSGLILLFERPIKVGDWIVTASGEGIVKRISVRSTEIETFDWASIIVPNSELISSSVTNWTHKNRYTRITVLVGVGYGEDPEAVSEILMTCARENKRTLNFPAPVVYFSGYGDSSLDFEVRIFINNVDDRIPVQNELRFAIFRAFKEKGIEIPFPQRDLHVRSIEPGTIMAGTSPAPERPEEEAVEAEDATPAAPLKT